MAEAWCYLLRLGACEKKTDIRNVPISPRAGKILDREWSDLFDKTLHRFLSVAAAGLLSRPDTADADERPRACILDPNDNVRTRIRHFSSMPL